MSKVVSQDKTLFFQNNGKLSFQNNDFKIILWKTINAEKLLGVNNIQQLNEKYNRIIVGYDGKERKNMTWEFKWLGLSTKNMISNRNVLIADVDIYNLSTNVNSETFLDHIKDAGTRLGRTYLTNIPPQTVRMNYYEATAELYIYFRAVFIENEFSIEIYFLANFKSNTLNLNDQNTLLINLTDFAGIVFESENHKVSINY